MAKQNSIEDEIRAQEEEEDDDDDMFSDFSPYMSPVRLSNSENSNNFSAVNDVTRNSNAADTEMGGRKEDISADNSSYSSPVSVSNFENLINTHVVVPDFQKEEHEQVDSVNDTATDIEHNSTYSSKYSSPERFSNFENSINTHAREPDIQKEDHNENDIELRGHEEHNSTYNSSYSSPERFSTSENSTNTHAGEPAFQKEEQEKVNSINDTETDIKLRGQEEHNSTYNSYSSPDRLSASENLVNTHAGGESDIQKEEQEQVDSVNDTKFNFTANDIELRGQKEHNSSNSSLSSSSSSPDKFSTTENSTNTHDGEPAFQKEEQEKVNSINDTETDIELRGQEEHNSTYNSYSSPDRLSASENSVNTHAGGEPDIQKEEQEQVDSVNDTKFNFTATDIELRGQKEHNSSNSSLSSSSSSPDKFSTTENSTNTHDGEPAFQKENNLVLDTTGDSIITNVEIRGQEADNSTDTSPSFSVMLSDSEKSINAPTVNPDIDQENDTSLNDVIPKSVAIDNEIRRQEEDNLRSNSSSFSPVRLSNSENLINALASESNVQNVNQYGNNFVNDTTVNCISKDGEIMDCVEDQLDTKQLCEMIEVDHQSTDKGKMNSKDVSHVTSREDGDGESLFSEEIKDVKHDSDDHTSGKKEESLVLYGTREPKMELNLAAWQEKSSVFTNFAKFKSLYSVSKIFRRLSGRTDKQIDLNVKDKKIEESDSSERGKEEVSQTILEKPILSAIRISPDKNQENKTEVVEVALESSEIKAIKGRIILYTKLWCKDCKEARIFLRKRSLRYSEINLDVYPSRKLELEEMAGSADVPRVFFNQELIGGLNELKALDESGQLEEKIEYVMSEGPSPKAPLPPFSGEDDVSSRGVIDELAVIVKKMKESIVVKDRFYKFRRVTNCFLGSEAVDFLSEDQYLEREEAIEFGRKLAKELFFQHVLEENIFEDGKHLYRFLDQDPVISQCQNIPRGIIQLKRQPLVELSHRLSFLLYAILDAYISEDGKRVAYRTIHGSEEFARYLRIAEELQRVDLNRIAKEERLAFFINLYNLMAIHAILVWGHPEGALDRRKLFNDFKYVIGGRAYSLSDIYNGILRSNQRPPYTLIRPFGITDKRFKVSLPYPEPLIHFALASGNRSAPALRCYSPKNIDRELMEAARDFLKSGAFILHLDSMTVSVTKILKWYSVDFGRNEVEVLKHAANYLEVEKTQTLELLDSTQLKVVYQPYDWRLNS